MCKGQVSSNRNVCAHSASCLKLYTFPSSNVSNCKTLSKVSLVLFKKNDFQRKQPKTLFPWLSGDVSLRSAKRGGMVLNFCKNSDDVSAPHGNGQKIAYVVESLTQKYIIHCELITNT